MRLGQQGVTARCPEGASSNARPLWARFVPAGSRRSPSSDARSPAATIRGKGDLSKCQERPLSVDLRNWIQDGCVQRQVLYNCSKREGIGHLGEPDVEARRKKFAAVKGSAGLLIDDYTPAWLQDRPDFHNNIHAGHVAEISDDESARSSSKTNSADGWHVSGQVANYGNRSRLGCSAQGIAQESLIETAITGKFHVSLLQEATPHKSKTLTATHPRTTSHS